MASSSTRLPLLLLLLLLLCCCVCFVSSDFAKDRAECEETLVGLSTCLTYVQDKSKVPTPDCCDGLSQILSKNRTCLCVLIKDRDEPELGFKFNATRAMLLPSVCHASSNLSECPMLLGLAPHSKEAQIFEQFATDGTSTSTATASPSAKEINDGGKSRHYVGGRKWMGGVVDGWAVPLQLLIATLVLGG